MQDPAVVAEERSEVGFVECVVHDVVVMMKPTRASLAKASIFPLFTNADR